MGGDLAGTAQNVGASVGSHGADRLGRVTSAADAILHEALELSPEDRADVAAELLASLEPADDPEMVRTLWAQELEERAVGASCRVSLRVRTGQSSASVSPTSWLGEFEGPVARGRS